MRRYIFLGLVAFILSACGGGGGGSSSSSADSPTLPVNPQPSVVVVPTATPIPTPSPTPIAAPVSSDELIKLNQLGYLPSARKVAIVPDVAATTFTVINTLTNNAAFSGDLTSAATWDPGAESVKQAEFSELRDPRNYIIRVAGVDDSYPFEIAADVYNAVHDAALKAYYFNRSSTELLEKHAGVFARAAGHPDTNVLVHSSAATQSRPADTPISSPKGWYDAGDYGKYVVNSGISTYTLMLAYEQFPDFYNNRDWNIPESGDITPDILDEIKWNLDWLMTMQDEDNGVYHKLTTLNFTSLSASPASATAQRYVIGKSTAATLNFAAVMATASRIYAPFNASLAESYLQAAEAAWTWAKANPSELFTDNPPGVSTGRYDGDEVNDEFAWAAAELFIATENASYLSEFQNAIKNVFNAPGWPNTDTLGFISLVENGQSLIDKSLISESDYSSIEGDLRSAAQSLYNRYLASEYDVALFSGDFYWGSNSNALNNALILMQGYRISGNEDWRNAAMTSLDNALGKNPIGFSYVTGYGDVTPQNLHHRPSVADNIAAPVPGFLVGGPNQINILDNCEAPEYDENTPPAKKYVDKECSYFTNEITINWNAPLVYMLAAAINTH